MDSGLHILIVEDEPLIAEDIAGYLREAGICKMSLCSSAAEAKAELNNQSVDAAILDINLEDGEDGIGLAHYIRQHFQIPFIYLTSFADKGTLERAKPTCPDAYLLKPFNGDNLLTAMEVAVFNHLQQNEAIGSSQLTIDKLNAQIPVPLSEREFDLLLKLKQGLTNKEIAVAATISVNTVKTHLQNLFVKLDAKNRTEAIFQVGRFLK